MRRLWLSLAFGVAVITVAASALWVVTVGSYFLLTGGTFGYTTADGTMVCGIPVFTAESWPRVSFVLFGIPLAVCAAGLALLRYCRRRMPIAALK